MVVKAEPSLYGGLPGERNGALEDVRRCAPVSTTRDRVRRCHRDRGNTWWSAETKFQQLFFVRPHVNLFFVPTCNSKTVARSGRHPKGRSAAEHPAQRGCQSEHGGILRQEGEIVMQHDDRAENFPIEGAVQRLSVLAHQMILVPTKAPRADDNGACRAWSRLPCICTAYLDAS